MSSKISDTENGIKVQLIQGDDVLKDTKISLIKMDLEGGEENALRGLKYTISQNMPMLAVCIYHKLDDMIRIPECIASITENTGRKYKYYLRHRTWAHVDTVLYAIPD